MKLIFLLQKQAWFVEHEEAWYRILTQTEIELALSCLAINMVNQHDLIEQPHQAGTARLTQPDERSLSVSLKSTSNQILDTLTLALKKDILINLDWNTKKFRDGWMSSTARLTLENVGDMFFDAYLPARSDSQGKTLTISNDNTGRTVECWLARDQKTRVPVIENGRKGKVRLSIRCEPELMDKTTDPRQLGFILLGEEAHPCKFTVMPQRP